MLPRPTEISINGCVKNSFIHWLDRPDRLITPDSPQDPRDSSCKQVKHKVYLMVETLKFRLSLKR
jgi:hypothetical protein